MNESNLKPFKPGQSGNPAGRPKKIPQLELLIADTCTEGEMQQVIQALLKKAKAGHIRAIEILLDRLYGKAKAQIDFNDVTTGRIDFMKLSPGALTEVINSIDNGTETDNN